MIKARTVGAVGFMGVAMFPMLGNALALLLGMPRRLVQFAFLATSMGLLAGSLCVVAQSPARGELQTQSLLWASIVSALLVARMATGLNGDDPSAVAWAAGVVTFAWLTLLVYHLLVRFPSVREEHDPPGWFQYIVAAAGVSVAAIAYAMGPEPGDAYMAFGGSTIQMGTGSAILAGVALGALTGFSRVVALVGAIYLTFVSTSRTGILLTMVLSLLVILRRAVRLTKGRLALRSLVGDLLILAAMTALVVLPLGRINFYPYWSSRLGPEGAHVEFLNRRLTDAEALPQRFQRAARLLRGPVAATDLPLECPVWM